MAEEFAECRALGHSWRHKRSFGIDETPKGLKRPFGGLYGMVGRLSICSVCKCERIKWITRSGEVVNRYEHPEGYSRHGDERLSAAGWRRSFVAELFDSWEREHPEEEAPEPEQMRVVA